MMTNNVLQARLEFGTLLHELRMGAGFSLRELGERAVTSYSLVNSIEHGEKPMGSDLALKVADAFSLQNGERERFLLKAAATRKRDKLIGYSRALAPEIVNYVARTLTNAGVLLDQIDKCTWKSSSEGEDQLLIGLTGGQQIICTLALDGVK
jgi:transcriptional regulator with XRE-family HTH domain